MNEKNKGNHDSHRSSPKLFTDISINGSPNDYEILIEIPSQ